MNPFRMIIVGGAVVALLGASYLSFYGVGRASGLAESTQSIRTGSSGRGFSAFGRIK
jgi:hypothetical protein